MCKYFVNIVIFAFLPFMLWGNKIDSLQKAAELHFIENDKVAQLETYRELANTYAKEYQYNHALSNYQIALQIAQELKIDPAIFDILNEMGLMYFWQDEYLQAMEILESAHHIRSQKIEAKSRATNFSRIAEVYISLGIYDKALENQLNSLEISREIQDSEGSRKCS